ncbi:MAG: hypothetical protein IAG10_07755, partial [Planctomycetaceae bacterium]|nr:hypothetical protein [Planctomycetaceae bacterium]
AENGGVISAREFVQKGGFSREVITRLFDGGWSELRNAAGIAPHPYAPHNDTANDLDAKRMAMITAAKNIAAQSDGVTSAREFAQRSGFSRDLIYRVFEGGWSELREAAGIAPHPSDPRPYTDEQLLKAYHEVVSKLRKIPTINQFNREAQISWSAVNSRFRGQRGIVSRYREWLIAFEPQSDLIELIPVSGVEVGDSDPSLQSDPSASLPKEWGKTNRTVYGEPISFRGLRHAPVNEQGVVYLFGMVSYELGFLVEAVHIAFPDCEAKRCINRKEKRWERVRIEFEFQSRNFLAHGHDPKGCDLIVCWEHNWRDCPIEVVELRQVLMTLDDSKP